MLNTIVFANTRNLCKYTEKMSSCPSTINNLCNESIRTISSFLEFADVLSFSYCNRFIYISSWDGHSKLKHLDIWDGTNIHSNVSLNHLKEISTITTDVRYHDMMKNGICQSKKLTEVHLNCTMHTDVKTPLTYEHIHNFNMDQRFPMDNVEILKLEGIHLKRSSLPRYDLDITSILDQMPKLRYLQISASRIQMKPIKARKIKFKGLSTCSNTDGISEICDVIEYSRKSLSWMYVDLNHGGTTKLTNIIKTNKFDHLQDLGLRLSITKTFILKYINSQNMPLLQRVSLHIGPASPYDDEKQCQRVNVSRISRFLMNNRNLKFLEFDDYSYFILPVCLKGLNAAFEQFDDKIPSLKLKFFNRRIQSKDQWTAQFKKLLTVLSKLCIKSMIIWEYCVRDGKEIECNKFAESIQWKEFGYTIKRYQQPSCWFRGSLCKTTKRKVIQDRYSKLYKHEWLKLKFVLTNEHWKERSGFEEYWSWTRNML